METYYTKKEYNEMKSILNHKLKAAEKRLVVVKEENKILKTQINDLKQKIHNLENPIEITMELGDLAEKETHVTED